LPSDIIFGIRITDVPKTITAAQLKAARALLGIDQRNLAEASGLSLPTIQRIEASEGIICGNDDSINAGAVRQRGGRGMHLKEQA
jgi:Helix-turn-helix